MAKIIYDKHIAHSDLNKDFLLEFNNSNQLKSIRNKNDQYQMNWLHEDEIWGTVLAPQSQDVLVRREFTKEGHLKEVYEFINRTDFDVFVQKNEIGIFTTFPDRYTSAAICMKERCHVHLWCGHNTTYLYGLRMGGEAPHLGMILTKGSIDGYSIKRNLKERSNDRGTIILHPEAFHLAPGKSMEIEWELLWFENEEIFFNHIRKFKHTVDIGANHFIKFPHEKTNFTIKTNQELEKNSDDIKIKRNGQNVNFTKSQTNEYLELQVIDQDHLLGEVDWEIHTNGYKTIARTLGLSQMMTLLRNRCHFIVNNQQYKEEGSHLDGAFLIYDNEDERVFYSHLDDQNGGRERIGMGVLLATYLQHEKDEQVEQALETYTNYIHRELFDEESGVVFNDVKRNND